MRTSPFAALSSLFATTDEQAMWRVQTQEDAAAFAQLVRRWEQPIQRLCARMLGDVHRGEDLAQETFARIFARRKNYEPGGKFSSYLWRIALNLCYDELRRLRRRVTISFEDETDDNASGIHEHADTQLGPDGQAVAGEQAALVRDALLKLPENYRAVLVLRHYEDLKFREIADVLEIPEGTVKSRMAEALTQLSRLLAPVFAEEAKSNSRRATPGKERLLI
ncbi:MAG: RNA polymerase sigma factor [Verrucomicrobia bacterium]|nr:RNA polymerase sigma factor [Verrucomicrobiota bacterium]